MGKAIALDSARGRMRTAKPRITSHPQKSTSFHLIRLSFISWRRSFERFHYYARLRRRQSDDGCNQAISLMSLSPGELFLHELVKFPLQSLERCAGHSLFRLRLRRFVLLGIPVWGC